MSNDEIVKKKTLKKIIVNLTNLLPKLWDQDNSTKRKVEQIMKLKA